MSAKKKDPNKIKLDKHIGIKLRNKRVERKLNQTKVANVLGVTFQQVQKYEKGSNGTNAFILLLLSEFFKVPISYFFEGFNPKTFESNITYHDRFPEIHRGNQVKNENLYPNPNTYTALGNKMKDVFLLEESIKKEDII
jgi:transcriptional regulator with XRE-family HTH domain